MRGNDDEEREAFLIYAINIFYTEINSEKKIKISATRCRCFFSHTNTHKDVLIVVVISFYFFAFAGSDIFYEDLLAPNVVLPRTQPLWATLKNDKFAGHLELPRPAPSFSTHRTSIALQWSPFPWIFCS